MAVTTNLLTTNDYSLSRSGASRRSWWGKSELWGPGPQGHPVIYFSRSQWLLKGGPKEQQVQGYRGIEWEKIRQEGSMQSWGEWKETQGTLMSESQSLVPSSGSVGQRATLASAGRTSSSSEMIEES